MSITECTCEKGFYNPVANMTGEKCLACPLGAKCPGSTGRALSKPLYFGLPTPHQDYFLRCHRMVRSREGGGVASGLVFVYYAATCEEEHEGAFNLRR